MPAQYKWVMLLTLDQKRESTGHPKTMTQSFHSFHKALKPDHRLIKVSTKKVAIAVIEVLPLSAVIVTEASIMERSSNGAWDELVLYLAEYARNGGNVIFALNCATTAHPIEIQHFFRTVWRLPWGVGSYTKTIYTFNPDTEVKTRDPLFQRYGMRSLNLTDVDQSDIVYGHDPASISLRCVVGKGVKSAAAADDNNNNNDKVTEAPVVQARFGRGTVGWVGDAQNEVGSALAVVAMSEVPATRTSNAVGHRWDRLVCSLIYRGHRRSEDEAVYDTVRERLGPGALPHH